MILLSLMAMGGGIYLFAIEHERNAFINAKISNHEVMRIADEHNGRLSVGLLVQRTKLDFTEAERKLYMMLSEGVFQHEYDENYQPVFVLNKSLVQVKPLPDTTKKTRPRITIIADGEVIQIAVAGKGKLTASILCLKAKIQYEEAQITLETLQRKGVFDVEVNENGSLVYTLQDWDLMSEE